MNHLPGLRAGGDADVVVFAGRTMGSAEQARDAWGSGEVTTDWAAAVARDDVDAVHVCVPNALHAEVAAAALSAGKHVLVEKPMTTTLADADALLAIDGGVLGVAFDARCNPLLIELRRLLPEVGVVRQVDVRLGHPGPQAWAPDATWFRDPSRSGGGVLLDLGSHVLDALAWCVGPITEVASATAPGPIDEEAELAVVCSTGTTARVFVSWQLPEPEFSFALTGECGTLAIERGQLLRDGAPVDVPAAPLPNAAAAFARALATGTPLSADGVDGRAALAAVLAGYAAAESGRRVQVA
ncbi:MAG: Gfo/Idh/MocA family oxidoreductase [Frankiaceae bacterium]|nr:Gfo/Idh/MocA family oxidoreductase [Frankiaceae bacterium]